MRIGAFSGIFVWYRFRKITVTKSWRTDFLFHSILSAAGIPSASIDGSLDVFSIQSTQDLPVASD